MKKLIAILTIIFGIGFSGCDGFLDVTDLDELSSGSVFKTETDMRFALNNLYTFLLPDDEFGEIFPYFWTDDAIHRNINTQGRYGSDFNWITVQQPGNEYILDNFYRYNDIADINFFLMALPDAEYSSETIKNRHDAEARFIRAWIYERMVLAYGDVPLVTTVLSPDDYLPRDPRQEVFDFVIDELNEIEGDLPATYPSADAGRITKGAVLALKARAFLNAIGWNSDINGMYTGARDACDEIISSGIYSLAPGIDGFASQFSNSSDFGSETILSDLYVPEFRTQSLARIVSQKGSWRGPEATYGNNQSRPGYTADFIEEVQTINGLFPKDDPAYDPADPWSDRDPRLAVSAVLPGDELPAKGNPNEVYVYEPHPGIGSNVDDITRPSNPTGYSFRKYIDYSLPALNRGDADYKIIRYAEVLLMYAESLAGLGDDAGALMYLDMVRDRVGMPLYADIGLPTVTRGTTGNPMIDAILLERRYEFAGEGPQRWFDIWRYKLGDQVIGTVYGIPQSTTEYGDLVGPKFEPDGGAYDRVWDDKFYLLPIRQGILDANPNLEQTTGWAASD